MILKSRIKLILNLLHTGLLKFNKNTGQIRIFLLLLLLILSWVLTISIQIHAANRGKPQEKIAQEIIRFHVIANSDSKEDQLLKYQVKEALVQFLQPYLRDVQNADDARDLLAEMLPVIQDTAAQTINEKGYGYSVTASISTCYFPLKVYGSFTFPPGNYEALQIRIGNAKGKNWWCVVFPPLCFIDETYSIIDDDGGEKLKYLLTEEEFESLRNNKVPVKVRFKLLTLIKKLFD